MWDRVVGALALLYAAVAADAARADGPADLDAGLAAPAEEKIHGLLPLAAEGNAGALTVFRASAERGRGAVPDQVAQAADPAPADLRIGILAYNAGDYAQALSVFSALARQGDPEATAWLGYLYEQGQGVAKDVTAAARWYQAAAEKGHAWGQNQLGSLRWYRAAAEQGWAPAQFNLGTMYHSGRGVPMDVAEARRWYRLAAEQGNAGGQYGLGWLYEHGEGVAKDVGEAKRLYELSAAQGNADAKARLQRLDADAAAEDLVAQLEQLTKGHEYEGNTYAEGILYKREVITDLAFEPSRGWLGVTVDDRSETAPVSVIIPLREVKVAPTLGYIVLSCDRACITSTGEQFAQALQKLSAGRVPAWVEHHDSIRFGCRADRCAAIREAIDRLIDIAAQTATAAGADTAALDEAVASYNAGEYANALAKFQDLAGRGNTAAMGWLGWLYEQGQGVSQDEKEAARWYHYCAKKGDAYCQLALGRALAHGRGIAQDPARAVEWYRRSAEQGWAEAQVTLGDAYESGDGVEQDYGEAVRWYRAAAEQNHAGAQYALGVMYERGNGVDKDLAQAAAWYRKAAEQGHADAQNNLGYAYEHGNGVDRNPAEALAWYRKAAEQGHVTAQVNLGLAYANGTIVARDPAAAVVWFRKAAEQGHAGAQYNLGYAYEHGEGVDKNPREAAAWYRKAAEQNHAAAQTSLGLAYYNGNGVGRDFAEAVAWWRRAAALGEAAAMYNMGYVHEYGEGVPQDLAAANRWYVLAHVKGHADPCRRQAGAGTAQGAYARCRNDSLGGWKQRL
jgi:hypothetical protein